MRTESGPVSDDDETKMWPQIWEDLLASQCKTVFILMSVWGFAVFMVHVIQLLSGGIRRTTIQLSMLIWLWNNGAKYSFTVINQLVQYIEIQ